MQYLKHRWIELDCKSPLEMFQILFLGLFFLECTIGGSGRIISFGYLSLRMILFIICFLLTLPSVWNARCTLIRQPFTWIWAIFFVFLGIYAIRGYLAGNARSFILQDVTTFLTLLLYPGIVTVVHSRKRFILAADIVFIGAALVAFATFALHVLLALLPASSVNELNRLLNRISCGGFSYFGGGFHRIYLKSQIFLQFAVFIGLYKLSISRTRLSKILLIVLEVIIIYAIILSYTRGFWLGLACSCVIILALNFRNFLFYIKSLVAVFLGLVCMFSLSYLLYGSNVALYAVAERFAITIDMSKLDHDSNGTILVPEKNETAEENAILEANVAAQNVRNASMIRLKEMIHANPVLGYGLGQNLDGLRNDGRTEYTYIDLLMKLGLVGFTLFALVFGSHAVKGALLALTRKRDTPEMLSTYLLAGYISVLITSYLNPFIISPMGITMLFIVILSVRQEIVPPTMVPKQN